VKFAKIKYVIWLLLLVNIQLFFFANVLILSCSNNWVNKTKFWAIVVGVGYYKNFSVDTRYSTNDAKEFTKKLEPYYGTNNIKLIIDAVATKINVRSAVLDWLAPKEDQGDNVLFYFAGHGNTEYLRMYDSPAGNYDYDISSRELDEWLSCLDSKKKVIIMDACGSGGFGDKIYEPDRIVISGGTGSETCWQEQQYHHGIFSYYLIQAISSFNIVDIDNDHMISVEEIFNYVENKVALEFEQYPPPSPQHPQIRGSLPHSLILFTVSN
jgi:uncharacterized caspase-like protein